MSAAGLGNRMAMWRAMRATPAAGFVSSPEPRTIGQFSRGKQLMAGNFLFAGHLVEAGQNTDRGTSIWSINPPEPAFAEVMHGFGWLDDLAAVGDPATKRRMQEWVWEWIALYGRGQGPGWTPDLTGRRLIRWINHALMLMSGRDKTETDAFYHMLSAQVVFLSRRWQHARPGLPRFEALTGLIHAGFALIGLKERVAPTVVALLRECANGIDADGGIPTRNPEELLEIFSLLGWAERALSETGTMAPPELRKTMERIAQALRTLRHADGGLARFHGGGRGIEGRLDQALATAGRRPEPVAGPQFAMGFARLQSGRTSVILDAAAPPKGAASHAAHASTLAFEMTSGRRPVVVNCGSAMAMNSEWRRAGRATASHSTLSVEGFSSSRLSGAKPDAKGEKLTEAASVTVVHSDHDPGEGMHLLLSHDGWSQTHGLRHSRDLRLSQGGRLLSGTDALIATTPPERRRFESLLTRGRLQGVGFDLRFHLHPDADAALDLGGTAVSIQLKSGEIWVFRHDGRQKMTLEPSVYLEKGRNRPRAARQIVLSGKATDFETRLVWTLAKAQDTPLAIRDLDRDDPAVPL
jgi:uncharacterized heparinase superfamily protein